MWMRHGRSCFGFVDSTCDPASVGDLAILTAIAFEPDTAVIASSVTRP